MILCFLFAEISWSLDLSFPFNCSDLVCNEYQSLDSSCDPLCMTPSCNYDSKDVYSNDWFVRFQSSACLSACQNLGCKLNTLGKSCDPSCNIIECGFGLGACGFCASDCTKEMLLNDICDPQCNTRACMYDNNACGWCAPNCFKSSLNSTTCLQVCSGPECNYQNGVCNSNFCASGCSPTMMQNSICDKACNVTSCEYDNWKCTCSPYCTADMEYNKEECFSECDTLSCSFQHGVCGDCNSKCFEYMIGDNYCDPNCNVKACKYDSGDCGCAPGCNSAYDPNSDSWTWDDEQGGCKIECLVEDCLFNFGVCKDPALIRAAWFQQLILSDINSNLNITNCTSKHPTCTEAKLREIDETGVCADECASAECLSCVGLAEETLSCIRTFGSYCLICQGTKQVYNYCFTADICPEGFRLEPGLKDAFFGAEICFRHPQKYSANNYFWINVSPYGNDNNSGDYYSPLRTISAALQKATRKFTAIYIKSGEYYYTKEPITNPLVLNPYSPLNFATNLYIQKFYLLGDEYDHPIIYLTEDKMIFEIKAPELSIYDIDFNGKYSLSKNCDNDLCMYCPNLLNSNGIIIDDRNNIIENSQDYAQNCGDFNELNFITMGANSLLYMDTMTISNFQQQFKTFIYTEGSLQLYNIKFSRIQSYELNYFITVICTSNCENQYFDYYYGSVTQLNYGYEYSEYLVQPGFMTIEDVTGFFMESVSFKYSMVITGLQETRINYLINVKNILGPIRIYYCDFSDALVNGIINVDSSTLSYSQYTLDTRLYVKQFLDWHLDLYYNTFNNIASLECILCYPMGSVTQNVDVERNTFTNIAANGKGVIILDDTSIFNTYAEVGGWSYVKVHNSLTLGWVDFRNITIQENTFRNIQFGGSVLSMTNQPTVAIENTVFENIMQITVDDINKYGPLNFKKDSSNYLSKPLSSSQIVINECRILMEILTSSLLMISDLKIISTSCPSGGGGINIFEAKSLIINKFTAHSITNKSTLDFILIEDIYNIEIFNMDLKEISMQATSVLRIVSSSRLLIENITGLSLSSLYKPCISFEKISNLLVANSSCTVCGTRFGDGGSLYLLPNTDNSSIVVQNFTCELCQAAVGFGGGVYIESYSSNLFHNLSLVNITFNRCSAVDGAGIYLSNRLSINTGIIKNLLISSSIGTSGGIFTDFHNAGLVSLINFTSFNNSGYFSAIKGSYLGTGIRISLDSVLVSSSQASDSIFYFSSVNIGTSANLSNIKVTMNTNTTFIYGKNMQLSILKIKIDSGLGVYIENSVLNASEISFIDLSRYAFRIASSELSCNVCSFTGIKSGPALIIENQSSFNITNSAFTRIYSQNPGIVLYMNLCPRSNTFENCTFSSGSSPSAALMEMQGSQLTLRNCAVKETSSQGITPGISLLTSQVYIYNSNFTNQQGKIGVFLYLSTTSSAEVYNSQFINGHALSSGGAIYSIYSTFKAVDCLFQNNKATNDLSIGGAIHSTTSSNLNIQSCVFIDNSAVTSGSSIDFSGMILSISGSNFYTSASQSPVISLTSIDSFTFSSSNITGINTQGIISTYTKNFLIQDSIFANLIGAIKAISNINTKPNIHQIFNSWFYNNSVTDQGGALNLQGISVNINNTVFMNNSADTGGAIAYSCPGSYCLFNISFCRFRQNNAMTEGGAIDWSDIKPNFSNSTFVRNSAKYGEDLASFPALLEFSKSSRSLLQNPIECAPGQICNSTITLVMKDSTNNIMTLDSSSTAVISTNNESYSVSGNSKSTAVKGFFTFTGFVISGQPGTEVNISISTASIDPSKAALVRDNVVYSESVTLLVKLRNCTTGEQVSATACTPCGVGTYVIDPSASCKTCPKGGNCTGGWKIYALPGYWKPTNLSEIVYSCPNSAACVGSIDENNYSGSCFKGYEGIQCFGCMSGYSRTGRDKCSACPEPGPNAAILLVLMIFLILQGVILVYSTIKSAYSKKSLYSIYIKIFTNYIQLIFLATQLDLKWPWFVLELFSAQRSVATSSDQIFSLDCYLGSSQGEYDTVFSKKLLLMALLPLIIWLISLIIWVIICIKKDDWKYLKKEYFASIIVLFFLVYPNIVRLMFSVFSCVYISESGFWMLDNLQVRCWDSNHVKREISIAVPAIIVWAIGTPTIVLIVLHKRRKSFETDSTKVIFGFLFNGYKKSRYFWEFLIMYRKILIICISVFLTQISRMVQGLTLIFVLVVSLFLQDEFKPYNQPQLNHMEVEGILTATITIYCGMYYYSEGIGTELSVILFLIIVAGNLYFVWYWIYYMFGAVLEALSSSFYFLRKLKGKTDPYPEYVFDNKLQFPGVIKDENEGILIYTLFQKLKQKAQLIYSKDVSSPIELHTKIFNEYAQRLKNHDKRSNHLKETGSESNTDDIELADEEIPNEREIMDSEESESKLKLVSEKKYDRLIH